MAAFDRVWQRVLSWWPSFDGLSATPGRLRALVLVALVLLFAATGLAAQAYREAKRERAAQLFTEAQQLVREGAPVAALPRFRAALALSRDELAYRRALAFALMNADRRAEARAHLTLLLATDPVDGEANLLMARLSADRPAEAERYYQRAIFGRWAREPEQRIEAEFELVDYHIARRAWPKARAELLRLAADLPEDASLRHQLARRQLQAGDATGAVTTYGALVEQSPRDGRAAAGLAEAALAARQYGIAREAASRAVALNPEDVESRQRLALARDVLALDPTARGLSRSERFRRAQRLLEETVADLSKCGITAPEDSKAATAANAEVPMDPVQRQLAAAKAALSRRVPAREQAAATADLVDLGHQLWNVRLERCGEPASGPLSLVFEQLEAS